MSSPRSAPPRSRADLPPPRPARPGPARGSASSEASELAVLQLLANERLVIDESVENRTCFMSHVGAAPSLAAGTWVAHREWVLAMALANLSPSQRSSLASALRVDHGREFGIGRLQLRALPSGLPLGGTNLWFQARRGGPSCLQVWGLAEGAEPWPCDWMILRARPEWALEAPPKALRARSVDPWLELGQRFLVAVPEACTARIVADELSSKTTVSAHPRFAPHLIDTDPQARVMLWPLDSLAAGSLNKQEFECLVTVGAGADERKLATRVADSRRPCELVEASCPGVFDRGQLESYWRACQRPRIVLRGDPSCVEQGAAFLRRIGAEVVVKSEASQLALFG